MRSVLVLFGVLAVFFASCSSTTTLTQADFPAVAEAVESAAVSTEPDPAVEPAATAEFDPEPSTQPTPEAVAVEIADSSTTVTPVSIDDPQVDLEKFAFELIVSGVASRAPEPVDDVVLLDPMQIETEHLAGLSFSVEGDETKVLIVPGDEPGRPLASAALLEQDSDRSFQVLISTLLMLEESDAMVDVSAHFGLRIGRARTFEGAAHSISLVEPKGLEGQDHYWILTNAPIDGSITDADLFDAMMALVPAEVLNPSPAARTAGLGDLVLTDHHLPVQLGDLRFGMTLDEFAEETGLAGEPPENDNRTYVEQEFATGDIEWVQYQFYKPDHVLYEVIIDFRGTEAQVTDLAFRSFGDELAAPAVADLRARATAILSHGNPNANWLLETPDHFDVWSWTMNNTVALTTTMPGTEFGFVGEG